MADLLKIITPSATYRWCGADVDIPDGAEIYLTNAPLFKRNGTKTSVGLEVDSLNVTIIPRDASDLLEGLPLLRAAAAGALDGAIIELRRAFLSDWASPPAGVILLFSGRVSNVEPSRTSVAVTVKSDVELLNVKVPRELYQPPCVKQVYSAACGVQRGAFTVAGTAGATGQTQTLLRSNVTSLGDGYFDQGVVIFKTGANAGLRRTVKRYTAATGQFEFALPLPVACANGDTFDTYPGCDKRKTTCVGRYANGNRFKGFRNIPKPEVAA
jgi:uncharacterized phage protein (TIGR02218 family)